MNVYVYATYDHTTASWNAEPRLFSNGAGSKREGCALLVLAVIYFRSELIDEAHSCPFTILTIVPMDLTVRGERSHPL
ncbi:hypothetical protein GJ744_007763 [Endocarpon pusillum]|uniref:Uncharacterized protein n=1 Tax=Endocarpon pusillum TaxID=364733 RepID=A0A8H7AVI8_9EURO|nr:hypothetical protein GJ744_007763 [Endocarpon pusillum]